MAKDLAWQIAATHGDPVGRAPCDTERIGFA
jgi:hypothetical protein